MEPQSSSAPAGPERGEAMLPQAEVTGSSESLPAYEAGPAPQEVAPQSKEGANQNGGPSLPPVQSSQPVTQTQPVAQMPVQNDQPIVASPMYASDIDVIEKEWVDKAKDIIRLTRDDPHRQEKEVGKLQADYLLKRYGKVIKKTSD